MISVVDPDARHGHKSSARGFDGYEGHASVDPDSELVMATAATAGNVGDAAAAPPLLAELVDQVQGTPPTPSTIAAAGDGRPAPTPTVYGDSAYGTGPLLASLHTASVDPRSRSKPRSHPRDTSPKTSSRSILPPAPSPAPPSTPTDRLQPRSTPPPPQPGQLRSRLCGCPLRGQCTSATASRTVTVTAYEQELAAARARQADPVRAADYRATRPKVERKLAHLVRRRHGGRRVRVRGLVKVAADLNLLAAAVNLARLRRARPALDPIRWLASSMSQPAAAVPQSDPHTSRGMLDRSAA